MTLPDLPTELILSIANLLRKECDFNALVQTNRRLHSVLNLALYQNTIRQGNNSALRWASFCGFLGIVQMLLSIGANSRATPRHGTHVTALHLASAEGHLEIVEALIQNGADVNAQTTSGSTALHEAVSSGFERVTRLLLDRGADFMKTTLDESRQTALHLACSFGLTDIVKLLLERGMGVEVKNGYMQTPLHCAVQVDEDDLVWWGNIATVELLLEYKAKRNAWDKFHRRPKDLVKDHPNKVIELLLRSSTDMTVSQAVILDQRRRAKCEQEQEKVLKRQEMVGRRVTIRKRILMTTAKELGTDLGSEEPDEPEEIKEPEIEKAVVKKRRKKNYRSRSGPTNPKKEDQQDISFCQSWPKLQTKADQQTQGQETNKQSRVNQHVEVMANNREINQQRPTNIPFNTSWPLPLPSNCLHPRRGWLKLKGKKGQPPCQMCGGVCTKLSFRCGDCSVTVCALCQSRAVNTRA